MLKLFFLFPGLFISVLAAPQVKLGGTTLVGRDITTSSVEFFGGIPFAEPPLGKLRFRSPVLKTRLSGATFDASNFGKSCLQPPIMMPPTEISEDCLSINIHRPAGLKRGAKLPVLFWTYGGAFVIGGANSYNGTQLVAQSVKRGTPIIYVNFNYRLGPFGYPQGKEAHDQRELNLGLKDIIAALEWVHANIDTFGGDKHKITIFGESAGAMNIGVLYLSKKFERLVRGAIFESGASNGPSVFTAQEREPAWQGFVKTVPSCSSLATSGNTFPCLQNTSAEEIAKAYLGSFGIDFLAGLTFTPTLDYGRDSLFPGIPSRLYKEGKFARVPYIAGTNLDEGTLFATGFRSTNTTEGVLRASVVGSAGSPPLVDPAEVEKAADRLLELYPDIPALGSPYRTGDELFGLPSLYKRAASLQGDMTFGAPRRQWMEAAVGHGVKSYGYLFSQPQAGGDPAGGVPHGAEIAFVYGEPLDPSAVAHNLSNIMMDYWISFTVNLDPNDKKGNERPVWPLYTKGNKVLIQLEGGNTTIIKDDYRKEPIAFINTNSLIFRR